MISPENQDRLDDLFVDKENEIKLICDELLKEAKQETDTSKNFKVLQNDVVANHQVILKFFAE